MAKNCENCGHCYIEQVIHVCGRNEGRLPLFDGDGNCKGWKKKRITNGDKFRAMSDEELAVWLALPYLPSPPWCSEHITCPYISEDQPPCDKCALDWLRQECE